VGSELFTAMRDQQPDKVLIQVNHPRSESLLFSYFDYIGLDAKTGVAKNPARFTTNWDLIEVFNGRCLGSARNTKARQDWIDLTNLGWKKTLSSGSDSHSEAAGVGHPRSWVEVGRAAVALDPQAIVAPLMARQAFVSWTVCALRDQRWQRTWRARCGRRRRRRAVRGDRRGAGV